MGKTALATNIAFNAAKKLQDENKKSSIAFFSLEMSSEQLANRLLSQEVNIPSDKIRRGEINKNDFQTFQKISNKLARGGNLKHKHASARLQPDTKRPKRCAKRRLHLRVMSHNV